MRVRSALLLLLAAACGDDTGASQGASDSATSGTTTADTTAATATRGSTIDVLPTTGAAGSHSGSDSHTGDITAGVSETGTGATASGTSTSEPCVDACVADAQQCAGADAVQVCGVGESGCREWGEPQACPGGRSCEGGVCTGACTDACTSGAKQCDGDGVVTCLDDPRSGCTIWSEPVACAEGQTCQDGACSGPVDDCLDDCTWTLQSVAANIDLYGVWGSSAAAVWTVGESGAALYFNGNTWKAVDTGITTRLDCVDGSGPADVYAISKDGKIIRWDGTEWTLLANLFPFWPEASCLAVLGPEDLLALTHSNNSDGARLWRVQSGVKTELIDWDDELLPPEGNKGRSIMLRAFSADSALATTGRVWRWDGVAAKDLVPPKPSYGLWALAPDFAYAAARYDGIGHRWDGQAWKVVNPALDGHLHMFTGSASDRIFVVGEQAADGAAAIVTFDGVGWSPAAVPADAEALFAAWTAPTGEVFAVGKSGTILVGK
jgi:hypothetical protein